MFHRRLTQRARSLAVAASLAATVLALGGCTADADGRADGGSADHRAGGGPSVVAPGKPGEAARTLSADEARKARPDDTPNSADFDYVRMMIQHHEQAIVMTELAAKRADSTKVERLADRIAAAQGPEIKAMEGWLKTHGGAKKRAGDHDHTGMPGMATEKQLDALRAARGAEFDEHFLKLMITHHTGAISMATTVLSDGNNVLVEEMAGDVIAQQTSEIGRMRKLA
ncbi:DUF305 domain-containing protein [Streptomyces sp. H27-D2]|uniref:DUF305 domain-containing protein n=1 Tax=Streptomyces sp. H27-D2 TaxID=3046304 RepID=UPI002DBC3221|nr:DUF305 domain-containing protein [Streptomyces sp. H27-D2]MEC4019096.1 DUF305 domain-containing protein [Streptomyces sp. H27-D2]